VLFVFFVAAGATDPIKHIDKIKINRVRITCSKELNHGDTKSTTLEILFVVLAVPSW
jgi:hypothetical protein